MVWMVCNRSKTSLMLLQPLKHTVASKFWWTHRATTLWLEMSPMYQVQQHDQHIRYPNCHHVHTRVAWWAAVYAEHVVELVDMLLQAAHECGLGSTQTNTSSMHRIVEDSRLFITDTGPRGPRKDNTSIIANISAVLLEWISAPAKARWASVVTTGPNMTSIRPWKIWKQRSNQQRFQRQRCDHQFLIVHQWYLLPRSLVKELSSGKCGYLVLDVGSLKKWCGTPRNWCARQVVWYASA